MSKTSSITAPESVLIGKLPLKSSSNVLHLLDFLPWRDSAGGRDEEGRELEFVPLENGSLSHPYESRQRALT